MCKALIIKSSSLDLVETPAKFYVRSLGQYFGGGMAFVKSTKLKTRLFRRGGRSAVWRRLAALSALALSNV